MELLTLLIIALSLALDAFSVSIACGLSEKTSGMGKSLVLAFSFGIFQFIMPLIGWNIGFITAELVAEVDHWIAFGILLLIGLKMLREAANPTRQFHGIKLTPHSLLMLSIATSIDAFAVGLSFAFIGVGITLPAFVIGLVAFTLSLVGVMLGRFFRHFLNFRMEVFGSLILIIIGIKILIDHLQ
ncbi:MAG: manganese efflux pump MntP family protein [Candidatus Bathyarchaeia archaeon]